MSEISNFLDLVEETSQKLQKTFITKNRKYFISTNKTWDKGWETMVFNYDSSLEKVEWDELDVDNYNSQEEAYAGHNAMIAKWEAKA